MPIHFSACSFGYHRRKPVISGFDGELPPGRTVFLGPNGAGKSTLLGLAASALLPRTGTVTYRGMNTTDRRTLAAYRRRIAWMPQQLAAVPGLTARDQVAYVGWLKGMSRREAWEQSLRALQRVELGDRADDKISRLSGGQQRRVGVAQSLVHGAEVLLLDEPTAGMDPRRRSVFHQTLGNLPPTVHVILSTHDTADLETVYDNVLVLVDGRIRFQGPVGEFLAHAEPGTVPGRRADSAYHVLTERDRAWA
ncbi:ATP-binding cassette domain-containing protein [Streptomyces zingiberis]|uniref:ATP-binding cassette domain-containing protein n=1 Tax=Streptomyces zingiberis TaxID=2053010 RepID=A0ABX1BN49_9ACTN|nr:ATP-binding cassette domain-containing protein [Streptomyces zingiberis]NJP99159.1 ATP-binding cassette domain-containing protein [Streptomyces zingiberis]